MGFFSTTKLDRFEDLFLLQLEDLYDAEKRLVDALPKVAEAASSPQLQSTIRMHLAETETQVDRLERIFRILGKEPVGHNCEAMKGLIQEAEEILDAEGDPAVKDAAIIAAAQRVEHYEIAGYGTARTFAERIGQDEIAQLLQQTLEEEKEADRKLTEVATESVNTQAAQV